MKILIIEGATPNSRMADSLRNGLLERDIEQAITALKKGAYLLKYGRRGKPKFCPFRLSNDESVLLWWSGKEEKKLNLNQVSKIIPGQRTAIFQRYPRPDKEYQSFSLIYGDRSLDLICKDKDEAEAWFVGLKALVSHGNFRKLRINSRGDRISSDSHSTHNTKDSISTPPFFDNNGSDSNDTQQAHKNYESHLISGFGNVFSDVILYTAPSKRSHDLGPVISSVHSVNSMENTNGRVSVFDNTRVSLSSAVSSSSHGSGHEDFDAMGDVLIWGETGPSVSKPITYLPKPLESNVVLDVQSISCGSKHTVLVTKQGEVFSWGEELGGRLGHGVDADVAQPKHVTALTGMNIEEVVCGEFHTCAVTLSGDLYTWGDGPHGHGSKTSHWIPKRVSGQIDGFHVSSVSCGPWHTAVVTSAGQLFTFGDGTFGVLGHGDRGSTDVPREVEALKGMRAVRVACGAWHTAAIVEINMSLDCCAPSGKLFTWGDGDKGRLGHGNTESRLVPGCVASLAEPSFCQVACGYEMTVALSTSGRVYTMGSAVPGKMGNPDLDRKLPTRVEGRISNSFVEEISCGSYHVAVLTAKSEVYTWGKGANGRLGHGDTDDRNAPTLVEALRNKQVKTVVCGSDFTAAICLHKWISGADQSVCSGCRLAFGFRRKQHNCYNCGLVFCKSCSSRKAVRASLAPNVHKPYRVCDECYTKLKKFTGPGVIPRTPKLQNGILNEETLDSSAGITTTSKVQGQLSRLSSADSISLSRQMKQNNNNSNNNNSISSSISSSKLPPSGYKWGNYSQMNNSSNNLMHGYGPSKKTFSASVPASRAGSRSTSPISCRPSPPYSTNTPNVTSLTSPETSLDVSNQTDDSLSQELIRLRSQVEELTRKSELLEAELEKTSNELRDARSTADEESSKSNAAKEVIKSLSSQLKEMAERVPTEGCNSNSVENHASNFCVNGVTGSNNQSDHQSTTQGEWVEQVDTGVYITVTSSPSGDKFLKRVRFSRKRYTEQQAEMWWAQNRSRLKEKYGILTGENSNSSNRPATITDKMSSVD